MRRFRWKEEKGQALTELMLVLPLLLVIILATIQFGYIFNHYLVLTGLARDGARIGSVTNDDAEIRKVIEENNPTLDITKLTISITPPESQRKRGDRVQVQIDYPVAIIVPFVDYFSSDTFSIRSSMTMRVE